MGKDACEKIIECQYVADKLIQTVLDIEKKLQKCVDIANKLNKTSWQDQQGSRVR